MKVTVRMKEYHFNNSLPFKKVKEFINSYEGQEITPKIEWWKSKSEFGIYFLNKVRSKSTSPFIDIKTDDWKYYEKVFEKYFLTKTNQQVIVHNIKFLNAKEIKPIEDHYFIKYIVLKRMGMLNSNEIDRMDYKTVRIIYNYLIGEIVFANLHISAMIEEQMKKEEEKQKNNDMVR